MSCVPFQCARSCRTAERVDLCRFMPLFARIGVPLVTSHTTAVKVIMRPGAELGAAVRSLGGQVLGQGTHALYGANAEQGYGFTLPGWRFPLVLSSSGELRMDRYGNAGNAVELGALTAAYVRAAALQAAEENRWVIVSDAPGRLVLRHPSGGRLTVKADGTCDASGFVGDGCHATEAIERAIGQRGTRRYKPEFQARGLVTRGRS
jgi:hypothetical protein